MQERKENEKKKRKLLKQLVSIVLAICILAGVMPMGFEVWKPLKAKKRP